VAPKLGKEGRLICDQRWFNLAWEKLLCLLEKIECYVLLLRQNDYLIEFDLKAAYKHLLLAVWLWGCHGFRWLGTVYFFAVLPFGDTFAVPVFEAILLPIYVHLRRQQFRMYRYLDDGSAASTLARSRAQAEVIAMTFTRAGWAINWKKTRLWAKRVQVVVGVVLDLDRRLILIPTKRRRDIFLLGQQLLAAALDGVVLPARVVAAFMGKVMSCWVIAGESSRLRGRRIYQELAVATGLPLDATKWMMRHVWDGDMPLSLDAASHVHVIMNWVMKDPSKPLWPSFPSPWECMIVPDTGEDAHGLVAQIMGWVYEVHGWLPQIFKHTSSALRELFGLLEGLLILIFMRALGVHMELCIQIDNFAASRIVKVGSSDPELQLLAWAINFVLNPFPRWRIMWAPRTSMMVVWADELSKLLDACDFELSWQFFDSLDRAWGPFTIDRAASFDTCKVRCRISGRKMFNSRYWTRGTSGKDMLLQTDWAEHANYVNPPFHLIPAVIHVMRRQKAYGLLLTPDTASRPWWPLVQRNSLGVVGVRTLPHVPGLIRQGGVPMPRCPWRFRAVLFDFRVDADVLANVAQ